MKSRMPDDILLQMAFGSFTPDEVVMDVSEINKNIGSDLYIIIGIQGNITEFIGCPDKDILPSIAAYCNTFISTEPSLLIHVKPYNPEMLPVDIPNLSMWVWVLFGDLGIAKCSNVELAAKNIETLIEKWPRTNIDEFAVLIGKEETFDKKDYDEDRGVFWSM